ncbi:Lipase 5 [Hypsizygus marmoreus]|uniref:Lipase 5 n=1 Tax=Hypsizygus marmoreus TaxID=39966 RepID=A0A369JBP4_HYPMA|nr:Lipase 5 [Hypsizygus marmoreus]
MPPLNLTCYILDADDGSVRTSPQARPRSPIPHTLDLPSQHRPPRPSVASLASRYIGLLDQELALQWVQKHITLLGGDPAKVSIWGECVGAGSVLQHVIAHNGRTTPPLFRAAITSSTFSPSQYKFDDRIPEALYSEVVAQTNCSSAANSLACLRDVDAGLLETVNVNIGTSGFFGTSVFVPVIDGIFITQRPIEALKQRNVNGMCIRIHSEL